MAYIQIHNNHPGIIGLMMYKYDSGRALSALAQQLLHGPSPLSKGERELIAAHVSRLNGCAFCCDSHTAAANAHFGDGKKMTESVLGNKEDTMISHKLKALLQLASQVQQSGKAVKEEHIAAAKAAGAEDEAIHDTVLIAAAFCMFNRYVDGLGTIKAAQSDYPAMGERMAKGYLLPPAWLMKIMRIFVKV